MGGFETGQQQILFWFLTTSTNHLGSVIGFQEFSNSWYILHSRLVPGYGWILTKTIIKWFSYDPPLPSPSLMSPTFPTQNYLSVKYRKLFISRSGHGTLFGSKAAARGGRITESFDNPGLARDRLTEFVFRIIKSKESL